MDGEERIQSWKQRQRRRLELFQIVNILYIVHFLNYCTTLNGKSGREENEKVFLYKNQRTNNQLNCKLTQKQEVVVE